MTKSYQRIIHHRLPPVQLLRSFIYLLHILQALVTIMGGKTFPFKLQHKGKHLGQDSQSQASKVIFGHHNSQWRLKSMGPNECSTQSQKAKPFIQVSKCRFRNLTVACQLQRRVFKGTNGSSVPDSQRTSIRVRCLGALQKVFPKVKSSYSKGGYKVEIPTLETTMVGRLVLKYRPKCTEQTSPGRNRETGVRRHFFKCKFQSLSS